MILAVLVRLSKRALDNNCPIVSIEFFMSALVSCVNSGKSRFEQRRSTDSIGCYFSHAGSAFRHLLWIFSLPLTLWPG